MERSRSALFLFIACMCSASAKSLGFTCKEAERNALLKLKHGFTDKHNLLGSWVGGDCCRWKGVGCDNVTGHVIKLDLRGNKGFEYLLDLDYLGEVSESFCLEVGEINPVLLELKYLTYLDLSGNNFNGSSIPEFIGSMGHLQYLNLSYVNFGGKIPYSLGNLTKLVVLDLNRYPYYFTFAPLQTNTLNWAFKLTNLEHLDLSLIDLIQVLNSLHILLNLPSLSVLNLEYCRLENSHLIFKNSTVSSPLQHLNLGENFFNGSIPPFIQNWSSITYLDLSANAFIEMGKESLEWASKLENLQYLDLSWMDLSQAHDSLHILLNLPSLSVLNLEYCRLGNSHLVLENSTTVSFSPLQHLYLGDNLFSGPIPNFIQNLSAIRSLDLSVNSFRSPIPSWLSNNIDLKYINLRSNLFNGSFPLFVENLSFVSSVDLSENQFSSSIPSWLADKRYLTFLHLSNNLFDRVDGGIMNTIVNLCSLVHLDLSNNQLQEKVLEPHVNFSKCSKYHMEYMDMKNNNLSGQLPTIGSLVSLQYLDLSHNGFEIIPASFGKLMSLTFVDVSHNKLSVVRQENLVSLSSLRNLDMSSNSLDIDLSPNWLPPFQLNSLSILSCKLNSSFPKWLLSQGMISELDLSDTGIYGPLPNNIGDAMPSLSILLLANNNINGSIPRSSCNLAGLELLDLQHNMLSGEIPDCWVSSQIQGMELSSNRLSGHIPSSLANSDTLQLLSMNNNLLQGELPSSLRNCVQLMVLDVGKNNLHGEIPSWLGAKFPSLEILILRDNRFSGIIPPHLCLLQALQIIDLASNNLVGNIPPCFGHFGGMSSVQQSSDSEGGGTPDPAEAPTMKPDEWSAVEVIKGAEREYTTVLHLLVNMDLSCNNLVGAIPAEITSLALLRGLNLSHNHFIGGIPKEIGKMRSLESLDFSFNNLSGEIPESISSINSLSALNLSFNNLRGQIPTGGQLQTFLNASIYMGNPGLCGDPLLRKCSLDNNGQPPSNTIVEDEDIKHEKVWFYLVIMSGFAIGFWGVIGSLVFKNSWRHAYFQLAEDLAEWLYVRVAVRIAQIRGRR